MTPLEYDKSHIWHPYATIGLKAPPARMAVSADGLEIELSDGRRLIDAVSCWWCMTHGHRHPAIVEAIERQSKTLPHVMFGGFSHPQAVELAERLAAIAPTGLNCVFFADSGSISVEVAAKMAVQYHAAQGHPERCRFLALKGGYHGDTSLCMALSDPDGMHTLFQGIMTRHFFAEKPSRRIGDQWHDGDGDDLRNIVARHSDVLAGIICEPIFQAANAMNFYNSEYLQVMRRLCDESGTLLIFDEIAAGFHRTGPRWAHSRAGVIPDIMTVGKALTGGHVSLAAALASSRVADVISSGHPAAFMHGPTFMANPIACAAANASLALFESANYEDKVATIERNFHEGLNGVAELENVADVRILGAVAVVELKEMPTRADIDQVIDSHGVWLRPFANYAYAMPPLVSDAVSIKRICEALRDLASRPPAPVQEDSDFHE